MSTVPARKGIQRRRAGFRGAAVTGAVLIAGLSSCQEGGLPRPPAVPQIPLDAEVAAAVERARTEVEADRRDPAAWMRLGMTFAANELPQQAAATYETAARLAAEDPEAWYHLGLARARTGALAPAIEALGRAGRLDTSYAPLAWRRGFFRLETGDLAGAGQDFRRARRLDPEDVAGTTGLARLALQQGEAGTAAALLESLTARQPREPYYHQLLGRAYLALGRRQEAEAAFRRGEGGSMPRFDDPWEREADQFAAGFAGRRDRALAAFAEGRLPDAIGKLRSLLKERPGDGSLSYALAVACDAPFLRAALLEALLARRREDAVALPETEHGPQPMPGVYPAALAPTLAALLESGRAALRDLTATAPLELLAKEEVRALDPEGRTFMDLDTPDDLAAARAMLDDA